MKAHMVPGLTHQVPHMIETVILGGGSWLAKFIGGRIAKEWRGIKETLGRIESTAKVQAENHLTTIQANTSQTNVLLEKVVDNQIELNGWLKGRASRE
jgi:hypothetical protein